MDLGWATLILGFAEAVLVALISAGASVYANRKSTKKILSASERHSAKQSILQLILEDQFNVEVNHELPRNYSSILNEYEDYHANGGDGEITERVENYKKWRLQIERRFSKG